MSILQLEFPQLWLNAPARRANGVGEINQFDRFLHRCGFVLIGRYPTIHGDFTYPRFGVTQQWIILFFHRNLFCAILTGGPVYLTSYLFLLVIILSLKMSIPSLHNHIQET